MQTESNIKPKSFEIEDLRNGKMAVSFFDNIEEKEDVYSYDMYRIVVNDRDNLFKDIENNYDLWLQFAKDSEYQKLATEVREKRDRLLTETDWTQVVDTALNANKQEEYKLYRQELRDITEQEGFPYKVVFPVKPME